MLRTVITLDLPQPGSDAHVVIDVQGQLPTIDLINALDALMKGLCLDVIGPETEDGPALAERMKQHLLVGRYELQRSTTPIN